MSHCSLVKKSLLNKYPLLNIEKEFVENNSTVDEAINMSEYFKNLNYEGKIIIITSNWHIERSKYLFNITFNKLDNITLEYHETDENEIQLELEEKEKLYTLKNMPYGNWFNYINEINSN